MKSLRLSATQINMYLNCPRQYALRYIENLKIPPGAALKQGAVAHMAYERNYGQKAQTQTDLPLDEMTDFVADTWDQELQREEVIFDKGEGETPASCKDQSVKIVRAHHTVIAPTVMPAMGRDKPLVEYWINVPLTAKAEHAESVPYELVAKLDLIDVNNLIRDNKTVKRTPNQIDIDKDVQLSVYALARRIETKQAERGLAHDVVVKNKTPKAVTIQTERSREQLILTLNQIGHVARGIAAQVFPINPRSNFCSPKYCGYASRCIWGTMPKRVDLGENLEQKLTESIEQVQQEKSDAGEASDH